MNFLSGRAARRQARRSQRLRGAGYTRAWRKGRTKRKVEAPDVEEDGS